MRRFYCLLLLLCAATPAAGERTGPLPEYVLQLPDSIDTVLIAETDTGELLRYERGNQGMRPAVKQPISIGLNGVGKERTGDKRTPLGIYFIVESLDTTRLHEKYGPMAFPLDYPNARDVSLERTGHGIWIHGVTPNSGPRPARDTDGCIALPNEELLSLEPYLTPLTTPVIVTRRVEDVSLSEAQATRGQMLETLQGWSDSFRDGDWHRYLSHYAETFSSRGMNRDEWLSFRLQSHADRAVSDVRLDDVLLMKDPEEADLYLARFRQTIVSGDTEMTTVKRLYLHRDSSGAFRIVAEDNG